MKVKILVEEEILKKGIEQYCIERQFQIVEELREDVVLISDKNMSHEKKVLMFSDIYESALSKEKVKLLKSCKLQELGYAIESADSLKSYTQKSIQEIIENLFTTKKILEELDEREKSLVEYIYTGLGNKDIAKRLYLSEKTVKNNLTTLYRKFEVKNRTELTKKCKLILTGIK